MGLVGKKSQIMLNLQGGPYRGGKVDSLAQKGMLVVDLAMRRRPRSRKRKPGCRSFGSRQPGS
jgi:hypothetical protein